MSLNLFQFNCFRTKELISNLVIVILVPEVDEAFGEKVLKDEDVVDARPVVEAVQPLRHRKPEESVALFV